MPFLLRQLHWLGIVCGVILFAAGAVQRDVKLGKTSSSVSKARFEPSTSSTHVPIESIHVGDRVLTGTPADQETGSKVDPRTWKQATIRAEWTWPDGTQDVFHVETLQGPEWLTAQSAAIGQTVPLPLDVHEMGCPEGLHGEIISLEACPPIADGPGKVVLPTVNHLNPRCRELEVVDTRGVIDRIRTTDFHPFWSETKQGWVQAYSLSIGDQLLGLNGERLTLQASRRIDGVHTVYNLTVEDEHVYRVGLSSVLVHNNGCDLDDWLYHGTKSDQTITTHGLDITEIERREFHDPDGFSLTPYVDIAQGFADNPLRPGEPSVLRVRRSILEKRGVDLNSETELTEAGEVKILPQDFPKVLPTDFEIWK